MHTTNKLSNYTNYNYTIYRISTVKIWIFYIPQSGAWPVSIRISLLTKRLANAQLIALTT